LTGTDDVRRDAALARLTVIGTRATEYVIAAYRSAPDVRSRIAALQALERIGDPRALELACEALQQGGDVGVAAAAALEPILDVREQSRSSAALDALIEAALDPSRDRRVRVAAYDALKNIPPPLLARVAAVLDIGAGSHETTVYAAVLSDAIDGRLPDDPRVLQQALAAGGHTAPLGDLQKLIEAIRERERTAANASLRAAWLEVRGAAHHALARRDSRVALYDLRETLESARAPLPASFLSAMRSVGDASCVEPLAAALARAPADDLWWRHQLASALRGIIRRERITKRHAAVKRALARWPAAAEAIG
jgi:hypothetical protein